MEIDVFEKIASQDASWADLGSIWVAKRGRLGRPFGVKLGLKRVRKSDAKKGLVLVGSWGGVGAIGGGSLWAGSDKGETELRLPLRLLFGLCGVFGGHFRSSLPCFCLSLLRRFKC